MNLNEKVLWGLHIFSWEAYNIGKNSNESSKNPYIENSSNWYSWNRGKNEGLINLFTKK